MLTVGDLSNPNKINKTIKYTLPAAQSIKNISADFFAKVEGEVISVTDKTNTVVGSVNRERLKYLVDKYHEMDFVDILDSLNVGIIVIDKDSRIFYVNPFYSQIVGVELAKILGRYMRSIEPEAALLKVLENGKKVHIEKQLIKSVNKYVSTNMFPLKKGNEILGAFSVFTDITQIKKLESEVERISNVALEFNRQIEERKTLSGGIVGNSKAYRDCIAKALKVSTTDAAVLLRGENGSGKEILSQIIKDNSNRGKKPFITVNCSAIPESLIESELFGYEEGAFTGAVKGGRMGKFQLADGGTLFLDEIGDMPFHMQAKLLRVLQTGEIEKVGRQENIPVDVRVIAATNKPLEKMVKEGTFREDLYYRLNVISIIIPPLRERGNDVILLAEQFLEEDNVKYGRKVRFDRNVLQMFMKYEWPGNVRELKNVIESSVILCDNDIITVEDLPERMQIQSKDIKKRYVTIEDFEPQFDINQIRSLKEEVEEFEKKMIRSVLNQCNGDKEKAMEMLGISRRTFYRKITMSKMTQKD